MIAKLRHEYQIDDINELLASPAGAAIHVRLFEFFAPVASSFKPDDSIFRPDAENTELMARPLLEHWRAGRIPTPAIDLRALHAAPTEVVMIAGRYDHTCDYRSQIALASCYPNHRLFIVDDDHMFKRMAAVDGLNRRLFAAWRQGTGAPAFKSVMAELTPLIWRET